MRLNSEQVRAVLAPHLGDGPIRVREALTLLGMPDRTPDDYAELNRLTRIGILVKPQHGFIDLPKDGAAVEAIDPEKWYYDCQIKVRIYSVKGQSGDDFRAAADALRAKIDEWIEAHIDDLELDRVERGRLGMGRR